jgi:transcriptional regulator with XRE-family HTH domain
MPENVKKILCERLKSAREYLGLSQEEVAQHIGVPRPAISQIENGNRRVDVIELSKLAKLYQRPVAYFTGEEPVGEPRKLQMLKRAAAELSEKDRDEVLRFAEFLRTRAEANKSK